MKNNDYLFAVASARSRENALLKQSDIEQLINSESYKSAISFLNEKGYDFPDSSDYSSVLDNELEKTWEYINNAAPEAEALNAFIVKNDFQNLKAILKSEVTGNSAANHFVKPCVIEPEFMLNMFSERKFSELPPFIVDSVQNAFDVLTTTGKGQICDAVLDKGALEAIKYFANLSNDKTLCEYADCYCAGADIKTAYRAIKTGKNKVFLTTSIADCELLDTSSLINAAAEGMDEFLDFLSSSGLSDYREALESGGSAFEKYCDDKMLLIIKKAKMTAFGISPLAAYYVAKETELKCLRIILSAKLSHVSGDVIRERMRELYV